MNVLFIPESHGNPYQKELANALSRYGINVIIIKGSGYLPILSAVQQYSNIDLVHLHWTDHFWKARNQIKMFARSVFFATEIRLLKLKGCHLIWTIHNLHAHDSRFNEWESRLNRYIARVCCRMIVHCPTAADAVMSTYGLPQRYAEKIRVIPQGHYTRSYTNQISPNEAREVLGLEQDVFVFLFFGAVRQYKGVFDLISAFQNLGNERARLLIAGKPRTNEIEEQLLYAITQDDRIIAQLTFVQDEDVQLLMNAADVVVLPFRSILTSASVMLSASFKKAVIAPNSGCIPYTIGDGGGLLYDLKDDGGLLGSMKRAIDLNLNEVGNNNFLAVGGFDWEEIAIATRQLYEECFTQKSWVP